jgi:CRISPR-associated protein Cas5
MSIDISLLFEEAKLNKKAVLTIRPLAPLSMVNSIPGSYYKTEHFPTKFMLCGLFENILGLHFSDKDRRAIRNKLKQQFKREFKLPFPEDKSPVGYLPIVHHLFEIQEPIVLPPIKLFEDLWTQHLIGSDERHLKGVTNYDWKLESGITQLENSSATRNKFFTEHQNQFPFYYRSPQRREFLIADGDYLIKIHLTDGLFQVLKDASQLSNSGYLGTSEGWVNLSLKEL